MVVDDGLEHTVLVAEHVQLPGKIEAMLGGCEDGEARLDVGLLVEELADGAVDVAVGVGC